jgi:hypothetical protein
MMMAQTCQPLAESPPRSEAFRSFSVRVKRLRIELLREIEDLLGAHQVTSIFDHLPDREVLEMQESLHQALGVRMT